MVTQAEQMEVPSKHRHSYLTRKTISGLWWTLGTQSLTQGSRLLISVVLTRLLAPSDFGLLAMTVVFTGFASLFSDFGFSNALVQRTEISEAHKSSVFWLNLSIGFVLASIAVISAPHVARFYAEPRLTKVMMLVAVNFPIASLSLVQKATLMRAMEFRLLGIIDIGNILISGTCAIALALCGFGVWSLVCQLLLASILTAIGTWWVTGWRPQWSFTQTAVADLFGFSANLLGFSVVNYWIRNSDNLLVGKYFGSRALGIYARTYTLMVLPLSQVTWVICTVMFPALSRIQTEKVRVRVIYLRTVSIIALITFPLMMGLFVVADHFVIAVFGAVWVEMIPVLRIFCILGMLQSVSSTVGLIYQSQGRTDWMFRMEMFCGLFYISAIILGVWMGTLAAVATCLTLVGAALLPLLFDVPGKLISITMVDVARSVCGVTACAAVMAGCVWILGLELPASWPHSTHLSLEVFFGMTLYTFLIHRFQLAPYQELRRLMVEKFDPGQETQAYPDQVSRFCE